MKKKGLTLIELLLYIAISSILLVSIFAFISLMLQSKVKAIAIIEVENQGMSIMENINRNLRTATTIQSPQAQSEGDQLIFSNSQHSYDYELNDGVLFFSKDNQPFVPIHDSRVIIDSIKFYNLSYPNTPGIVTTQMDVKYNNPGEMNERNYEKMFYGSAALRRS